MRSENGTGDLAELELIASTRPDRVEAVQALADAYADAGRWQDAADTYRAAIQLEPAEADLYNSLATVYEELGEAGQAEQAYRTAIELAPDDPFPHYNLGLLYEEQGRQTEAMAAFEKCLEHSTDPDEQSAVRAKLMRMQPESQFESFEVWQIGLRKSEWTLRIGPFETRFTNADGTVVLSVPKDRAGKRIPFVTGQGCKDIRLLYLPFRAYNVTVRYGRKTYLFQLQPDALERLRAWRFDAAAEPPLGMLTKWRLALVAIYGLVAALALGYAWYLVATATNIRHGYAALIVGLIVGIVVSFFSGANTDLRYSVLGTLLSGVGVAYGELLIFAMPSTNLRFRLEFVDLVIYGIALYEGWITPQRPVSLVRRWHGRVNERNWRPVLMAGVGALVLLLGASAAADRLPSSKATRARTHFDRAMALLEEQKTGEAKAECKKAIELKPDYARAHMLLGAIHLEQGNPIPAITSLSEALEYGMSHEDESMTYGFRALARAALSMYDDALADFDEAIALDDDNPLIYYWRGMVCAMTGERERAVSDLERALELGLAEDQAAEAEALLADLRR